MGLEHVVFPAMIIWLLAMLYGGPSYFRRLAGLTERLADRHEAEYQQLGQPMLRPSGMRIDSTASLVSFVLRRGCAALEDEEAARLGDAVRRRLLFSFGGVLFPLLFAIDALLFSAA